MHCAPRDATAPAITTTTDGEPGLSRAHLSTTYPRGYAPHLWP